MLGTELHDKHPRGPIAIHTQYIRCDRVSKYITNTTNEMKPHTIESIDGQSTALVMVVHHYSPVAGDQQDACIVAHRVGHGSNLGGSERTLLHGSRLTIHI